MEHSNNVLAVFAILLILLNLFGQLLLYNEAAKVTPRMEPVTGKASGTGIITLKIKYPLTATDFIAEVADDNESIFLSWGNYSGDNYSIYVADNSSQEFNLLAEGLTGFNYTDTDAGDYSERYYKLEKYEDGNSEYATKIVGKYDIDLTTDNGKWNYISLPVGPSNTSISDVLKTIDGKYEWVYEYHASSASFSFWFSGFGSITDMYPGRCYIIQPFVNTTLTVAGDDFRFINKTLLTNDGRWNYIGWLNKNETIGNATASIAGDFDWIYEYMSSTGAFNFYFGGGGSISNFEPSRCYIIQPTVNNTVLTYTK